MPEYEDRRTLDRSFACRNRDSPGGFQLYNHPQDDRRRYGVLAAGSNQNQNSKTYFKGQKMKVDTGDIGMILDFDAQTITTINNRQKTVTVKSFGDISAAGRQNDLTAKIDVKETGQKKTVNGYNASELIMTMEVDGPPNSPMGKMQMEMDMWISPDVPGAGELRAFYQKNMSRFPWAAMGGGGGNQSVQTAMAEMQRRMAEMNGVQVLQVMKMKSAGGAAGGAGAPAMPQLTPDQQAKMKDAMARLQAMQAQGGPAAAAAQQAMARMGAVSGGAASSGAGSGSLMEMTMESSDFSTGSIPDSTFGIPAGYQKVDSK